MDPAAVTATNAFGNVIARAADGAYWRICPEGLNRHVVARDDAAFEVLRATEEFQAVYQMTRPVELARAALGPVSGERCHYLMVPAVLGGAYDAGNLGTITRGELLAFTGHVAEQIKDVSDGASVQFEWTV